MRYLEQEILGLTSSNISQDYSDWDENTTYVFETDGSLTNASVAQYGNYYWRSTSVNNLDSIPSETNPKWQYLTGDKNSSVSNRFALLDVNSKTKSTLENSDIVVEFERKLISSLVIGEFEASQIKIEHLDNLGVVIPQYTQVFDYGVSANVGDIWGYIYIPYTVETGRNKWVQINPAGEKIRITVVKSVNNISSIGFLWGARPVECGRTIGNIDRTPDSYKTEVKGKVVTSAVTNKYNFQTLAPRESTVFLKNRINELKTGLIVVFVIDDTQSNLYENVITLGELQSAPQAIDSFDQHIVSWTVYENP